MRRVDTKDLFTCSFQGRVFELSAQDPTGCSSAIFIRRFMRSATAQHADEEGSFGVGVSERDVLDEVNRAFDGRPYGSARYPTELLFWIGFTYRYWCFAANMSSKMVYSLCSAKEMSELYYAYHTLDPAQCVDRILESKGLSAEEPTDEQLMRLGLAALRRIRSAETNPSQFNGLP